MQDVAHWLSERLMSLPEAEFAKAPHRKVPDICRKVADFSYYSIPLSNGVGTSVLAAPREPRPGPAVMVILSHALGFDSTYPYWHWIEALNSKGLYVLSVDWDGHGVGNGSSLDLQAASRSIPLLLQRLYGDLGNSGMSGGRSGPLCYLMGHAAGGAYGLLAASRVDCARLVSGVIAISPTVNTHQDGELKLERWEGMNPVAWLKDFVTQVPFYGVAGVIPPTAKRQKRMFPLRLRFGIDREVQLARFVSETFVARRILRNVQTPVLWIHGAKDKRVPLERALSLMMEIPSALFTHVDEHRGHTRLMFSNDVPAYAAKFIDLSAGLK
jgi:alpha-beta hydrolase superfamily lysophospholipase